MKHVERLGWLALLLLPLVSGCVVLQIGLPLAVLGTIGPPSTAASDAPIPAEAWTRYADLPQSFTEEGFARLDSPSPLIVVEEYGSYACPHCGTFHETVYGPLIERVRSGEISFVFIPFYVTGNVPNGEGAALAAVCAGEQGRYWQYHDALFYWQSLFGQEAFTEARLRNGALNLDLDVDAWQQCMSDPRAQAVLRAALESASAADVAGTPAIFVNGRPITATLDAINAEIDKVFTQ